MHLCFLFLALTHQYDMIVPVSEATLKDMVTSFIWIHQKWQCNQNNWKHNRTTMIFDVIKLYVAYITPEPWYPGRAILLHNVGIVDIYGFQNHVQYHIKAFRVFNFLLTTLVLWHVVLCCDAIFVNKYWVQLVITWVALKKGISLWWYYFFSRILSENSDNVFLVLKTKKEAPNFNDLNIFPIIIWFLSMKSIFIFKTVYSITFKIHG